MKRGMFLRSLAVLVVLSGCQASSKTRTVVDVAPGERLIVREAPFNGEYRLFRTEPSPGYWARPIGEPLATHRVGRGEWIGFRRHGGELQAVAADELIPIERGGYLWQMHADAGQMDWKRTVGVVLFIAGATAVTGQIIFAMTF